jgi:TonB-linked SusC/RagA family outer membrane protein
MVGGVILCLACLQVNGAGYARSTLLKNNSSSGERIGKDRERAPGYFLICCDARTGDEHPDIMNRQKFSSGNGNAMATTDPAESTAQLPGPIEVSGRVTDSLGNPLIGVTIKVQSGDGGTVTGPDGRYTITVPDNATLMVTYVGYEVKEIPVNGKTAIDITLSSSVSQLNQLVVVGYGTQKKIDVTGAISAVQGDDLKQSPAANLSNSIAGRIPGVVLNNRSGEPGNDASTILIRGKGTLNDNSPLIVIDGVPARGGFDRLNPDDVESVTVLKDASAAIYGARAANGVILVTTKRGKIGKPTITYNGSYGLTQPTRLPNLVNAWQYATYINEVNDRKGIPHQFSEEDIAKFKDGSDPINHPNTDWYHEILKEYSPQTRHALSVRGGTERVSYYVSGNYLYQDGIFRNSAAYYHQYNLRSNIDAQITDNLKVSVDLSGRLEDRHYSNFSGYNGNYYTIFGVALGIYPTLPAFYPNGLPGPGKELGMNPVLMASGATGYQKVKNYAMRSNLSFTWQLPDITEGLYVSGLAAYDFDFNSDKMFNNRWDVYRYDEPTDEYVNMSDVEGPINLDEQFRHFRHQTYNFRIGYARSFGKHNITSFVAYEQSDSYDEGIGAYRTGFPSGRIDQIDLGANAGKDNSGNANHSARQDIFGRIAYNYQHKYLAEFILRHDGSFNFPNGKRWGTFPAVSVGWGISEEPFFRQSLPFIDQFKIKASWGRLGNDRIDAYQYLQLYYSDGGYYLGPSDNLVPGLSPGVIPNVNVTWEVADNKNVGFESSFFNNLFTLNADYFVSKRSNILVPRQASIPTTTGLADNLPDENIGKVRNSGFEVEVTHHKQVSQKFSYDLGFNYTYTKNKVIYMDEAPNIPEWQKQQGYPMDSWLVYKSQGVYHTQEEIDHSVHLSDTKPGDIRYVDVDGNGSISSNDRIRIYESPIPRSIYGITMGFTYGSVRLDALWQGQGGAMQMILPESGDATTPPVWMFERRWTEDHPDRNFPASFDRTDNINSRNSDFWLQNASFLRLKTVELSYTFPRDFVSRLKMENLNVYVNAFNVLVFSPIKYYDPEINVARGDYYPQTRIFNIGVNASF